MHCIGQGAAWYLCFDSHMIAARAKRVESGNKVSETISKSELAETHAQQLIPAGHFLHAVISLVLSNNFLKFVFWNNIHKLRKNNSASVHDYFYF